MKLFLTGATGFVGKSIVQHIPNYKYCVYNRGDNILECLDTFKPDVIIHSAAEIYDNTKMLDSNVILTHDILNYVKNNDVIKTIYIGSSSEYGKVFGPMKETDICKPESIYAATKSYGTLLSQAYSKTYNKDICVIRPFSLYGPNEPPHRLIPTVVQNVKHQKSLKIIEGIHDFIHIHDFIRLLNIVITSNKTKGEIFNAGFGESYSNKDIVYKIFKIIGKTVDVEFLPIKKISDSEIWMSDTTKTEHVLGFKCAIPIDIGLTQYIYH
jgi:nucleoside-diphosphate-sugar epimerase